MNLAGSAFSCRIAFSNAGLRDIYVIPISKGKTGKLLLMEKHPFRTQKGVVIAIAPLPGLSVSVNAVRHWSLLAPRYWGTMVNF